jgi:hypothetical protein
MFISWRQHESSGSAAGALRWRQASNSGRKLTQKKINGKGTEVTWPAVPKIWYTRVYRSEATRKFQELLVGFRGGRVAMVAGN